MTGTAAVFVMVVLLVGCAVPVIGPATPSTFPAAEPTILRGEAHSAEGAISIETDDWTYGVPLDGVSWVDRQGALHTSGRPECLPPAADPVPVPFAAVEVTVDGSTWRPVVWIDCRD